MARKLPPTRYAKVSDAGLEYIIKDATEALRAIESFEDPKHPSLAKYADQVNDACTEKYRRSQRPKV
jgi:hypothetical protein